MGGNLYMMDATRRLTASAIDTGEKPAVLSAIAKYHITERARQTINDGMDVIGGKGICMGPSNFLGGAYMQHPVAITVEGANILTRSLIIFGQGAIRCHPYLLKEIAATRDPDREAASIAFDAALFGHVRFTLSNLARTLVMGLTGSHFVRVPDNVAPETRRYYQQLTRFSAALAFLADVSMGTLGGALKRKEKLSARLGDILSLMYLCSATLRRYEAEGRQAADAPLMHWAIWDAMFKAQGAFEGVISNFPNRVIATLARRIVFPLGRPYVVPSDHLGHQVASLLIEPSATRDRLTAGMFIGQGRRRSGRLDRARAHGDDGGGADPGEAAARDQGRPARRHACCRCEPARACRARRCRRGDLRRRGAYARHAPRARRARDCRRRLRPRPRRIVAPACHRSAATANCRQPRQRVGRRDGADLHHRRRSHAVPQGAQQAGPVRGVGPRDRCGPGAAVAAKLCADATRRGDPGLRGAVGRRGQHRPGGGAAHGLRAEGAGVDGDAQLRIGHAVDRLGDQQHPRRPLQPRARGRGRCAVACAAAVLGCDGGVAVAVVRGEERRASARRCSPSFARRYFAPVIALMKGLTDPICGLLMGQTAENLAYRFGITRQEMDAYAARSHARVLAAQKAGHFAHEVTPIYDERGNLYAADDGVREDSTVENLAKLKPFFDRKYGNVTAGNSSQVTDGGAWVIVASQRAVDEHQLTPIGRIVDSQWAGLDPAQMGLGPVYAATPILQRHGLGLDDLDAIEINEAFAAQVLACERAWADEAFCRSELGLPGALGTIDPAKLNVDGGAIAIGHPVGASGTRIVLHVLNVLRRTGGKRGLAAICIGGGLGGAMLLEQA